MGNDAEIMKGKLSEKRSEKKEAFYGEGKTDIDYGCDYSCV